MGNRQAVPFTQRSYANISHCGYRSDHKFTVGRIVPTSVYLIWTDWNHIHRKLANLITRTTALSNSVKLSHAMWGHPKWMGHGREVWQNVVHWRRECQTTSVFLPWEPHKQYERQKDKTLKDELPWSVGAQYATEYQWRNNSRKNEGMEPKQKEYPVVDVTGDRSKVWCCNE